MNNFKNIKISDLPLHISDGNYSSKYPRADEMVSHGVPFIRANNLKNGTVIWEDMKYISSEKHEELQKGHLEEGDVLITVRGDIGKLSIVPRDFIDANINAQIALLRVYDRSKLDNKFLFYSLNTPNVIKQFNEKQTGTALKQLPIKSLREVSVLIPAIKEQQKIAEILSSVDAAIEKTEQVIAKTEEVKKGLMQQLLTKGIGHTEFKQTEIGEIPLEWEVVSIESFSTVIRGASPRPKGDPRYYGGNVPRLMGADVTRDKKYVTPKIDFLTEEGAKLSRQMSKGDFVIVCSGTVGLPAILAIDACIHDGFLALKDINPKVSKEYLYYIFTQLRQQLDSKATHGGVFTNLTTQIVKEFKIALPSIDEQENISNILKGIDDKIDLEQKHMDKLSDIKKGLMQQLLTGKTRVKID